jgi:hypothetical protein
VRCGGRMWAGVVSAFRVIDRCAASCCAGSTATPRAGEIAWMREVVSLPASWRLLPLRDGRGYACGVGNCRSPFAL